MKKSITFLSLLFIFNSNINAQMSGVVTYKFVDWFGKPTTFKLYFDAEQSKYVGNKGEKGRINKVGETVLTKDNFSEVTTVNKTIFTYFIDPEGDCVYKNWKDSVLILREIQQQYPLIVKETRLPQINWTLIDEKKKIGKFLCQKATTTFRGRKYDVWFTSEIPIPTGPWKLHGLPGLILEAQDETKKYTYLFEGIEIPLNDKSELSNLPKTGDIVAISDYDKEVKKREAHYNRALVSKAAERGTTISVTPHNNPPQELNFDK